MEAVLMDDAGPARASAPPFFSFEDGPIAQAAKLGLAVLLEDIDAPSQVSEPLTNSDTASACVADQALRVACVSMVVPDHAVPCQSTAASCCVSAFPPLAQAIVERLNPCLETEPSLAVPEDPTSGAPIPIAPGFQVSRLLFAFMTELVTCMTR